MPTTSPRVYGSEIPTGISSRTVFRGDSTKKYLDPDGSSLDVHELGFDMLERRYVIRRDLLSKHKPMPGDVDFEYRDMSYWKHKETRKGDLLELHITFNGYREKRQRVVKTSYNTRLNETTLTALGGGAQMGLVFTNAICTSRYASPVCPPDDEPIAVMPNRYCRIDAVKGSGGIELSRGLKLSFLRDVFGLKLVTRRTSFDREQEGAVWFCTESVEYLPIQEALCIQL